MVVSVSLRPARLSHDAADRGLTLNIRKNSTENDKTILLIVGHLAWNGFSLQGIISAERPQKGTKPAKDSGDFCGLFVAIIPSVSTDHVRLQQAMDTGRYPDRHSPDPDR